MTHVLVLLLALLIGVVAGLRSLTAPAVVSWAAFLGWINLHGTWASWMGNFVTVVIVSVLAVAELVNDKRPKTPPRTVTPVFAVRIILAMPRATTASKALGMPGRMALGWGMGPIRWELTSVPALSARYGGAPVKHSCSTQASA